MGENRGGGSESSSSSSVNYDNHHHQPQNYNSMQQFEPGFFHNDDEISEAANKKLLETPLESDDKVQAQLAQALLKLPPLRLSLGKTPSFLDLQEASPCRRNSKRAAAAAESKSNSEKMKACNYCASVLRIGSWQRVAKHEGDLVVKCYYAKRKLVWEILDNGLKSKIEVQWSDIIGIRAVIEENKPGILEIEGDILVQLGQPPSFHRESDPQPKKHTMWNASTDFTRGEASKHRRHCLQFPPGVLDKQYKKLLQYESRFFEMSQRHFPSQKSPYFQSCDGGENISFNFSSHGAEILANFPLQFPSHLRSLHFPAYSQTKARLCNADSTSPVSVMDFSSTLDEVIGNQGYLQQVAAYHLSRYQIPQPFSLVEAHFNPAISCHQNFNGTMSYNQELSMQGQFSSHLQLQSYNNSMPFPENMNCGTLSGIEPTVYDHETSAFTNMMPSASDNTSQDLPSNWVNEEPQPLNWYVQQPDVDTSGYTELHQGNNNLSYSSYNPNPLVHDFDALNNSMNNWR